VKLSFNPLTIQIATIAVTGVLIISVTLLADQTTNQRSERSLNAVQGAFVSVKLDLRLHEVEGFLEGIARGEEVSVASALQVHDSMIALQQAGDELERLAGTERVKGLQSLVDDAASALQTFLANGEPLERTRAEAALVTLDRESEPLQTYFNETSLENQAARAHANFLARIAIIATVLFSIGIVGVFSLVVGRRLRRSLAVATGERDELAEVTRRIRKRNDQFDALYQVVNEVTDSLSMRYVVNTTVSEAARLVKADFARLRLLEGNSLVPAGSFSVGEELAAAAAPLQLGVGINGRAAKRGKTIRIAVNAEASMAEGESVPGMQSGLIVPLIVGARVLGTIACWSREPNRFDADDERILEMMAAQVASAVAAAGLHETSEQKASHDALTGLPNRRGMAEEMSVLQIALTNGEEIAVVMVDIDHFKRFNDDFGHRVGDVTLQKVAEVMRGSLRDTDQLYRYGGEEFLIALRSVGEEEAVKLIERLRIAVERAPLTGESLEPVGPVTISCGVALGPKHGLDLNELVKLADEALYQSKATGRNRVTLAQAPEKAAQAA
jgi:diguanylate cyclase (GGDEF)-like protein